MDIISGVEPDAVWVGRQRLDATLEKGLYQRQSLISSMAKDFNAFALLKRFSLALHTVHSCLVLKFDFMLARW